VCGYRLEFVGLIAMSNGVDGAESMEMWRWKCANENEPHVVLADDDSAMQDEEYARLHEDEEDEEDDGPDLRIVRHGYQLEAFLDGDDGYTYTIGNSRVCVESGFVGFALFADDKEARAELERRIDTAPGLYGSP
jgi:hypothetical protein